MKIGILGAGNVGGPLARLLRARGHSVVLSFSRNAHRLEETAAAAGVQAGLPAEAVRHGEVVVLATPYAAVNEALKQAGDVLPTKILWDCTTPFKPDFTGLSVGTTTSAAEEYAKIAPWANVVKAVPPFASSLKSGNMTIGGERLQMFVCGDDAVARRAVMVLVADIGAMPIEAGPLQMSRYIEPMNMFLVALAYRQGLGSRIALTLSRE
jgi:predicted dinucleotide-binding enzyme